MKTARRITTAIDRLNEAVGRAVSWLTTALVLLVCIDVFFRYLLDRTANWVMELEWHLFSVIFLLGAAYTLKHDKHVRVDLFYDRFSPRDKALVDLVGSLLFLLPWSALLVWVGTAYAWEAFRGGEVSPNPGGLPLFWPIKAMIPLGLFLLFLQGVAQALRAWVQYRQPENTTD
jgi:TRAP-type mannitol/chloroaromatic compound transport system permease small subunit